MEVIMEDSIEEFSCGLVSLEELARMFQINDMSSNMEGIGVDA